MRREVANVIRRRAERKRRRTLQTPAICPECRGERRIGGKLCRRCKGNAQISRDKLRPGEVGAFE